MNSVIGQPHRKGSLNIQEMCKKFESSSRQHSSSESELVSPKRSLNSTCSSTPKISSDIQPQMQPRLQTQWSKGKTQHNELMQKRQIEKQHLGKFPVERVNVLDVKKPSPHSVKPAISPKKSPSNGTCVNTNPNSQGNLVMQRMMVFETNSPVLPPKTLVHPQQSYNHMYSVSNGKSKSAKSATPSITRSKSPTYFSKNPTYEEIPGPKKPPRTFAHNRYIENRAMQPLPTNASPAVKKGCSPGYQFSSDALSGTRQVHHNPSPPTGTHRENAFLCHPKLSPKPVFVDLTVTTVSPPKNYGTLKRSFSEEHVYADPYDTIYAQHKSMNASGLANHDYAKPYEDTSSTGNLHYMSSSIIGIDKCGHKARSPHSLKPIQSTKSGKSSTPNVRDMFNNTFGQLWRKLYIGNASDGTDPDFPEDVTGDSGSEVSVKDVQERLIYVRSLKKKVLGNVISESSDRLFDGLAVACLTPARKDSSPKPRLIFQCPKEVETIYKHTMLPQLCFPDAGTMRTSSTYRSETFQFSIEDGKGCKTFGYCLRLLGSTPTSTSSAYITLPAVICLLTSRNAAAFYLKVLSEIEKHLLLPELAFRKYITKLYQVKVPIPGDKICLPEFVEGQAESTLLLTRPSDNRIIDGNLTLLLRKLEVDLLLKVISSLLLERRVILVSSQSSLLFKCTAGILSLLYPLCWQHNCLPVLPTCLLSQCLSSNPYLHGVPSSTIHKILDTLKDKIFVIDLDQGQILREVGDEHTILPNRVSKTVRYALSLAQNMTDPTEMMRDLMIAESFVRMFVELLGHSEQHIVDAPCDTYTFVRESFCKAPSSRSIQMFLQWFSETQMFEAFIEDRLRLRRTQNIRNQPGLCTPLGLYDRRLQEYYNQQSHGGHRLRENVRGLGKKVRTFGEKLKKAF